MLQLEHITKTFPQVYQPILKGINLTLYPGDFCLLVGNNGSGKSTLLKTLSGEYSPDQGKILLNHQDITTLSFAQRAARIRAVSQNIYQETVCDLTVLENLVLSKLQAKPTLSTYQQHQQAIRAQVASLALGLEQLLHLPMSALSGGQRQLIAILMASFATPDVLLFDEHCSALDPKNQALALALTLKIVAQKKCIVLMITHQLDHAITLGNRLIMLQQGQIILDIPEAEKKILKPKDILQFFHQEKPPLMMRENV